MESVDLIASGYEWTCPKCDKLNLEIEATETVTCCDREGNGCGETFEVFERYHALG